jgi:hypothetical protein
MEQDGGPVTIVIRHRVKPGKEADFEAWLRNIIKAASEVRVHCSERTVRCVRARCGGGRRGGADLDCATGLAGVRGGGFRGLLCLPLLREPAYPFFHPVANLCQHRRQAEVF